MPTDDQQILVAGQAPTPAQWKVPGNGQLRPKAVFAHFDGSGAATPFQPALKIVSDGGKTIGIYPTTFTVAAGASAEVSWFHGIAVPFVAVPGAILQSYFGQGTAADFTWNTANTETSSGYPANSTFTKISDTSKLAFYANGDFTTGGTVPNVLAMGLWVDGVLEENIFHHIGVANSIGSVAWSKYSATSFAAGAHTLDMKVWFLSAGGNWTFRCQAAVDFAILEIAQ